MVVVDFTKSAGAQHEGAWDLCPLMHVAGVGQGLLNVSNTVACFERFHDEVDSRCWSGGHGTA